MEYVQVLLVLISGSVIVYLFYGPWQNLQIDAARNALFSARDEVFDLANEGKLDFSSDEYKNVRNGINSMIRFSHRLSWPSLLVLLFVSHRKKLKESSQIFMGINTIKDEDTKKYLQIIRWKVGRACILLLLLRSFPLICFFGPLYLGRRFVKSKAVQEYRAALLNVIWTEAEDHDPNNGPPSSGGLSALRT